MATPWQPAPGTRFPLVAPSLLSADFGHLHRDIEMLNASPAEWLHCDIMDGRFVPNISFGLPVLEAIRRATPKPLDVHLMIVEPDKYLADFKHAGADILTVHYEACPHLHRTLEAIRSLGLGAGAVLNPHTPVHVLQDVLYLCDVVLLMSVNPGFGGQRFIERTYAKVSALRQMIDEQGLGTFIEIDGGVSDANAATLTAAGAQVLVAGNFVFRSPDPHAAIRALKG